jgi:hypothetical protein
VRFFSGNPTGRLLAELTGTSRVADIPLAHRALEAGGVRGKHVVRIG